MKRCLSLGLSLLLLCGCTSTVSTVTDPPENTSAPTEIPFSDKAIPLEQALAESREAVLEDRVNLDFPHGMSVDCPETVYQGHVMQMADFADKYADAVMHWWVPDEAWDDALYTPQEEQRGYPLGPTYNYGSETGWYVDVWCVGTAVYAKEDGWPLFWTIHGSGQGAEKHVATYPVLAPGTQTSDAYPVEDGTLTVAQAADMGNEFAQEWCALTDYPTKLRVEYVSVYDRGDGTYLFEVSYQTFWEQMAVCNFSCGSEYFSYDPVTGLIASTDGFRQWGGGAGTVLSHDVSPCEALIPVDTAVDLLSDKLSSYTSYDVLRVSLEYRFLIDGTAQTPDQYRITNADGELVPDTDVNLMGGSYQLYQLHPCWMFYVDVTPGAEVGFIVDAFTGSVDVIDNRGPEV